MLVKIVTFFLIFMAILAMLGRLRFPRLTRRRGPGRPAKCPDCGQFVIGRLPCACKTKG